MTAVRDESGQAARNRRTALILFGLFAVMFAFSLLYVGFLYQKPL